MAMNSSRLLFFLSPIFLQTIHQAIAQPSFLYYFCINDKGNYTANSTYERNLNQLLPSLTNNNTNIDYGFYNSSYGQNSDKVYAIGLCRGDVKPDVCHSCLQNSTYALKQLCPNQKEAIGWYDDCMLRYSNRSIFHAMEGSPSFYMWNMNNVSVNLEQFNQNLRSLLDRLKNGAAAGGSLRKFAVENATSNSQPLYALVQCTPDLSKEECSVCLDTAIGDIPRCCDGKQGGRVIGPSCNFRFEAYSFYDATAESPPPSPQLPPLTSPSSPSTNTTTTKGKRSNTSRTITIIVVIIVVPTVVSVVLIICTCIYLRVRKQREIVETVDEIGSVESLQFDFGTVRVATENFSDANKLGQGGFGAIYKGKLLNGQEIAVKRLSRGSSQGDLEFKNEVLLLAKLQHRNLVRLMGFCLQGNEKLLIYEFVPNASLDHFIFAMVAALK